MRLFAPLVVRAFLAKGLAGSGLQEKGGRLLRILTRVLSAFLAKYMAETDLQEKEEGFYAF